MARKALSAAGLKLAALRSALFRRATHLSQMVFWLIQHPGKVVVWWDHLEAVATLSW